MASEKDGKIWVELSGDEMSAVAFITPPEAGGKSVEVVALKHALSDAGITHGIMNNERLQAFCEQGALVPTDFITAAGTQPGHGSDASFELLWNTGADKDTEEKGNVDLRELNIVRSVNAGIVIARKVLPTRGEEGVTVSGKKTPGEWGSDVNLKAGDNVAVSEDGSEFMSMIDGSPKFSGGVLSVDPIFVVNGDVDYSIGNINFAGALEIRGSVMDGFVVKADGNIIISQNVQAAEVICGGDITVRGGIITRREGVVSAKGAISAAFIENSIVEADGDVIVKRAIINSIVRSNGSVVASSREGKIYGGEIMANREICAKHIGTENETTTLLKAGFKYDVYIEMADIETKLEKVLFEINRLQKSVAAARGVASEALENAKKNLAQLEAGRMALQQRIASLRNRFQVNPFATVKGEEYIHPGCMIYIGGAKEKVMNPLRFATLSADRDGGIALSSFDERTGAIKTTSVGSKEKKKTVMIVDDAKFMRTKLRNILENNNFKVLGEAEDGLQAVQLFQKLNPDLVTMDITMPNLDGIGALKEIKKLKSDARVVMISALGQKEKVRDSLISGAMDFVIKPFVPEKVVEVLLRVVGKDEQGKD